MKETKIERSKQIFFLLIIIFLFIVILIQIMILYVNLNKKGSIDKEVNVDYDKNIVKFNEDYSNQINNTMIEISP